MGDNDEIERRRAAALAGGTDHVRWADPANLSPAWDERARSAADLVPRAACVLDLGCGAMALEAFLPPGCEYIPCDLVARDGRTIVCDFNAGEFPQVDCDVVVALGVLEYMTDAVGFLRRVFATGKPLVISYNPAGEGAPDRRALGWVNDYTRPQIGDLLRQAGFKRATAFELGAGQMMIRTDPASGPRVAEKTVWAVSYFTAGNFGDRLGVQLLNQVLPAHAVVRNVSLEFLDQLPEGSPDLLVLGLGNSLYDPLVNERLLALLDRSPRAIGVFGTQYRDTLPKARLDPVLDRLQRWYARSEEDALMYGRGRDNVRHLGDWLVDAFPMARPTLDETLDIRASDVSGTPLDRVIARIQLYKRVTSGRLHPLLCAFTSAQEVAYAEQSEMPGAGPSGKFRSLLLDVFGRELPPQRMWPVDRAAVIAYKEKVKRNIAGLRDDIAGLLA